MVRTACLGLALVHGTVCQFWLYLMCRAGLCPWDNLGKANSWRPPPRYIKICKKKSEALQYCDSNQFTELTVGTSRVLMSKAATNSICSNKHKAQCEYTYVNTKTHHNRLKQIQPNYKKKSFATLFVCKSGNHHATVLRIDVWPVGDRLFGGPLEVGARSKGPARPTQRPALLMSAVCVLRFCHISDMWTREECHSTSTGKLLPHSSVER
jgi:hypothetical protein